MGWKDEFPQDGRYFETENGILYCGDCVDQLRQFSDESIDLVVTSPPYDMLRYYSARNEKELENVWNFDKFKEMAKELYRIVKEGGVVVWVVGDATVGGSETGSSFKQVLYFKDECGFRLHDTMIYLKNTFSNPDKVRYYQIFEYMFILSKGKPKTFNPIMDRKNRWGGFVNWGRIVIRQKDGTLKEVGRKVVNEYGKRFNVWCYVVGKGFGHRDEIAYKHPATFPERLPYDHVISWSNVGDIVLDPLCGSGTTLKMAERLDRVWIGIEINPEYCEIAKQRILKETRQMRLLEALD